MKDRLLLVESNMLLCGFECDLRCGSPRTSRARYALRDLSLGDLRESRDPGRRDTIFLSGDLRPLALRHHQRHHDLTLDLESVR